MSFNTFDRIPEPPVSSPEITQERRTESREDRSDFVVAVYGTSSNKTQADQQAATVAEKLGHTLIEDGYSIATGGYGMGAMGAVSAAAAEQAKEMGLTEEEAMSRVRSIPFTKDIADIPTIPNATTEPESSLMKRLGNLVDNSDAYIVLSGGIGTFLEMLATGHGETIEQMKADANAKPVIIIDESMAMTDILAAISTRLPGSESKLTKNTYVLSNNPEQIETVRTIIDTFYRARDKGEEASQENAADAMAALERYSLRNFIKDGKEFSDGGGI